MIPPNEIDVLDNEGFTCLTKLGTLWRPGRILKHGTVGKLQSYDNKSFYQYNDDVTRAVYKVPHYRYPVVVWFDNESGERIA